MLWWSAEVAAGWRNNFWVYCLGKTNGYTLSFPCVCRAPWGTDGVSACSLHLLYCGAWKRYARFSFLAGASYTLSLAGESTWFAFCLLSAPAFEAAEAWTGQQQGCAPAGWAAEAAACHPTGEAEEYISAGGLYSPSQTLGSCICFLWAPGCPARVHHCLSCQGWRGLLSCRAWSGSAAPSLPEVAFEVELSSWLQ